jgi:hypothetical protein
MHRRHHPARQRRWDEPSALHAHPEVLAEERLRSRRAQADQRFGRERRDLGLEPRVAGAHLVRARLLVDAPLAPRLPLEVLDGVGDPDAAPLDAELGEHPVE